MRLFVTGCSGYLAQRLISASKGNSKIEWIGGCDIRTPSDVSGWNFFEMDIRSEQLKAVLQENRVDTVAHLAWVFNPTHNQQLEYEIDVNGSRNVLKAVESASVPYVLYLSSTTAYGPHPDNPLIFDESYPRRGHSSYLYAKYKAEVDTIMLEFIDRHPSTSVFMIRACIVLGPRTSNIVTRMTQLPYVFAVRGYDPAMQFIHEGDIERLLAWAVLEKPVGVFNIAGKGTIQFSTLIEKLQKKGQWLPPWLLYPSLGISWRLNLLPFPPSILDFIRYPWVASTTKFEAAYNFEIRHTSTDALLAYAATQKK